MRALAYTLTLLACFSVFADTEASHPGAGDDSRATTQDALSDLTYTVCAAGCDFSTLDAGIAGAASGDTLSLSAESFTTGTQVVIDKQLTIRGAGMDQTTLLPSADTAASGDARGWFLVRSGTVLHLEDLTLDGSGFHIYQAVRQRGSGSVTRVRFQGIHYTNGLNYQGSAIVAFGDAAIDVTDCRFSDIGRLGVFYFGSGVNGSTVSGSTYVGKGSGDVLDYAVEVGGGADINLQDNHISACRGFTDNGYTSAAVFVSTFYGGGSGAVCTNNTLTQNRIGLIVGQESDDTSSVTASGNRIEGNSIYGVRSSGPTVNAAGNWWGSVTGPAHADNPGGSGDAVSDNVVYLPFDSGSSGGTVQTLTETEPNDFISNANTLPLIEEPAGSGLYTVVGEGQTNNEGDQDFFGFPALAGDQILILVSSPGQVINPKVSIVNAAGASLVYDSNSGPGSSAFISGYTVATSGTYYVRVENEGGTTTGAYRFSFALVRGPQAEADANYGNDATAGQHIDWNIAGTGKSAVAAGLIMQPEGVNDDEDRYALGWLRENDVVTLTTRIPAGSSLRPVVDLIAPDGSLVTDEDGNADNGRFTGTVTVSGNYVARIRSVPYWVRQGKRYQFLNSQTWTDAEAEAVTLGGHLVTIDDADEQNWLLDHMVVNGTYWLGLNDIETEGTHVWADGTPLSYTNWADNQPVESDDGVYLHYNGMWYGYRHYYTRYGLTEAPALPGETDSGAGHGAFYLLNMDIADLSPPTASVTIDPHCSQSPLRTDLVKGQLRVDFSEPMTVPTFADYAFYNGHTYIRSLTSMNYADATAYAESLGGTLLIIDDAQENAWVDSRFPDSYFWLGLTDEAEEGTFVWVDGTPAGYTNWADNQPSSSYDHAIMHYNTGQWQMQHPNGGYGVIVELDGTGADFDGDGLADTADPFPGHAVNAWSLVSAGADDSFDTPDDIAYSMQPTVAYNGEFSMDLAILDGPLNSGRHRLTLGTVLTDSVGNPLDGNGDGTAGDPLVHEFQVNLPAEAIFEGNANDTRLYATPLPLVEDPPNSGLFRIDGYGQGALAKRDTSDWWSFEAQEGDVLSVGLDKPDSTQQIQLYLHRPNGNSLEYDTSDGPGNNALLTTRTLDETGTWYIRAYATNSVNVTYRLDLSLARGLQYEVDNSYRNNQLNTASTITLTNSGNAQEATIAGVIMRREGSVEDVDHTNLGLLNAGITVSLTTDLPGNSTLAPIVELVNSAGDLIIDEDGDPTDGAFMATITVDDTYYARVRAQSGLIHNGRYYEYLAENLTWADAEAAAVAKGGHLATIDDCTENQWLAWQMINASPWIGLNSRDQAGAFVWADGTAVNYTRWGVGRPNNQGNGVHLNRGYWYDYPDHYTRNSLMEKSAEGTTDQYPGPDARYILNIDLVDAVPPQVTAVTGLPAQGETSDLPVGSFEVDVSEPLDPAGVLTPNVDTYNGHTYILAPTLMSRVDGAAYAQSLGGTLVILDDEAEHHWVHARFGEQNIMLGLTDTDGDRTFTWDDGSTTDFTHWQSNQPYSNYAYAYLNTGGYWYSYNSETSGSFRVVVELDGSSATDTDGDGIPDVADPHPADPYNAFDLRTSGADGTFDTADDIRYSVTVSPTYTTGTNLKLRIDDGPLGQGDYRLLISPAVRDVVGNPLDGNGDGTPGDAYVQTFTLDFPEGTVFSGSYNRTRQLATPLTWAADSALDGLYQLDGAGLGVLSSHAKESWWSFDAEAGDVVSFLGEAIGSRYRVAFHLYRPDGSYYQNNSRGGPDQNPYLSAITLPDTGTWYLRVYYNTSVDIPFQVYGMLTRGLPLEYDVGYRNDSTSNPDVMTLTNTMTGRSGRIAGTVMGPESFNEDVDHFSLGLLNAGNRVDLTVSPLDGSGLQPVVTLLDADNQVIPDTDGDPDNGAFSALLTADSTYRVRVSSKPYWIHNGRRYAVMSPQTWTQQNTTAMEAGGHLVAVNDAAEQRWLFQTFTGSSFWLGLSDAAEEGTLVWSSGEPVTYTNWISSTVNSSSYDYTYFSSNGHWYMYQNNAGWYSLLETDASGQADAGPGYEASYVLQADVVDAVPPRVTSTTLTPPGEPETYEAVETFEITVSEPLLPETVQNLPHGFYNGKTYIVSPETLTHAEARDLADQWGGSLLSLDNADEEAWIVAHFTGLNYTWLDVVDEDTDGVWTDTAGNDLLYENWHSNYPRSGHDRAYLYFYSNIWYSDSSSTTRREAIIEIDQTGMEDADGDGLPDSVDLYPDDALNGFAMRGAGADGLLDTPDDRVYQLAVNPAYVAESGTVKLQVVDGPLEAGSHRFTVSSTVTDVIGNPMDGNGDGTGGDAFQQVFSVLYPDYAVHEGSDNSQRLRAASLNLTENPAGSGFFSMESVGIGALSPLSSEDWWSFEGQAGDRITAFLDSPFVHRSISIELRRPDGSSLTSDNNNGPGDAAMISNYTLDQDGTWYLRATVSTTTNTTYRIRAALSRGIDMEYDRNYTNDNLSAANALTFDYNGTGRLAAVAGNIMSPYGPNFDEDIFQLGVLNAGNTISLEAELSAGSTLHPLVTVIDADGNPLPDDDPADGTVQVTITEDGHYYAQITTPQELIWNNSRYVLQNPAYWSDAEAAAQVLGGHLVTIDSRLENNYIQSNMPGDSAWIGLKYADEDGLYQWQNGTPVGFTNWSQNEPNESGWAYIRPNYGLWYDTHNYRYQLFSIVEIPAPGEPDSGPGLLADYILHVDIGDTVPPRLTNLAGIPTDGGTTNEPVATLEVTFSEPLALDSAATRFLAHRNGHTYYRSETTLNHTEAEDLAESLGGHLATIDDEDEWRWLHRRLGDVDIWLSLNDEAQEGSHVWADGSIPTFTRWGINEPNTSSYDYVRMHAVNGLWYDAHNTHSYYALIEIENGADNDGDGFADSVDLFPDDPLNAWDLREAGQDGVFDTSDDDVYGLHRATIYDNGQRFNIAVDDGPLGNGSYRLTATPTMTDQSEHLLDGNGDGVEGDASETFFTVALPEGYVFEGRRNHAREQAVTLAHIEDPAGSGHFVTEAFGIGNIADNADGDWWQFEAEADDRLAVTVRSLGDGSGPYTQVYLYRPDGSLLYHVRQGGAYRDTHYSNMLLDTSGTWAMYVDHYSSSGGTYHLRTELARGMDMESDEGYHNNYYTRADPITLTDDGSGRSGTAAGTLMRPSGSTVDIDYFNLGDVAAGESILLSLRLPQSSTLSPLVEIRGATGEVVNIATNPSDAVARFDVQLTGRYYATVVAHSGQGPRGQYLLDAAVRPTGQLDFADLAVTAVTAPAEGIGGQTVDFSWTVGNFGALATNVGQWVDQVVLSADDVFGNDDDVALGSVIHIGALDVDQTYTAQAGLALPHSIEGLYTVFVKTDAGNQVGEFIFENNNIGQAVGQIDITQPQSADLAASDLVAPALGVAGQSATVTWTVTNAGGQVTGDGAPDGDVSLWADRLVLSRDGVYGGADDIEVAVVQHSGALNPGDSYTGTWTGNLPTGLSGTYVFLLYSDAGNAVFEEPDQQSNLALSPQVEMAPGPFADLGVSALTAPASVQEGDTLAISFTVTNGGDAHDPTPTDYWVDRIILSTDTVAGNADDQVLATISRNGILAVGDSYTVNRDITIPWDTEGARHLLVVTDATSRVFEYRYENNNQANSAVTITKPPLPDLVVGQITHPTTAVPGDVISVGWQVTNNGGRDAFGPWTEKIYLSGDNLVGGDRLLGTATFTGGLTPGSSSARSENVQIPLDIGGTGNHWLVVHTNTGNDPRESDATNNSSAGTTAMNLSGLLTVNLSATDVTEGQDTPITATFIRSGSTVDALAITLTANPTGELDVPATVTIPAGSISTVTIIPVLADGIIDPDQTVTLTTQASGYDAVIKDILVRNQDQADFTLTLGATTLTEGAQTTLTITRSPVSSEAVAVALTISERDQLNFPASVQIPADTASVTVDLIATDDTLVENTRTLDLQAAALDFNPAQASITLTDNDTPTISIALDTTSMSEGDSGVTGTITRTPIGNRDLLVSLSATPGGMVYAPAAVTIPSGNTQATFNLVPIDNTDVDGDRSVTLTARVTETISTLPITGSEVTTSATVTDDDGPTLFLSATPTVAPEGVTEAVTLTLRRNNDTTNPVTVNLSSADTGELTVPPTVTIPAGEASTTFTAATEADGIPDGNQEVIVTAALAGYASATSRITVTDTELPDLVVTRVSTAETIPGGRYFQVSLDTVNQGLAPTPDDTVWTQSIYLSDDPLPGNDVLLDDYPFDGVVVPEGNFTRNLTARAPTQIGTFWLIVRTDSQNALTEIVEDNNVTVSEEPVTIVAPYTAVAATSVAQVPAGTPIPIEGQATYLDGTPADYETVHVHIVVRGLKRVLAAVTNDVGAFSTTFVPLPNEGGIYTLGAVYPGVHQAEVQDSFTLLGMEAAPAAPFYALAQGDSDLFDITLTGLGDKDLTGLAASLVSEASSADIDLALNRTDLPASETATLSMTVDATNAAVSSTTFTIRVTSDEGVVFDIPARVDVSPLLSELSVHASLQKSIRPGERAYAHIELTNEGFGSTGLVNVILPAIPWITVSTQNLSIEPNALGMVELIIDPPLDLALGPHSGGLVLVTDHEEIELPFTFLAVSDTTGDLEVTVVDEYTFFAENNPGVANAQVIVRDPYTYAELTRGITGADGKVFFEDLAEGFVTLDVEAQDHEPRTQTVPVTGGRVNTVDAFLSRQTVTITWDVEEVEILDTTEIVIESHFETDVPVPVIVVNPPSIDIRPLTEVGESLQVNVSLRNEGLIQAINTQLFFSESEYYRVDALVRDIGILPAKSEVIVPVTFTLVKQLPTEAGKAKTSGDKCNLIGSALYTIICGPYDVPKATDIPILARGCSLPFDWFPSGGTSPYDGDYDGYTYCCFKPRPVNWPGRPAPPVCLDCPPKIRPYNPPPSIETPSICSEERSGFFAPAGGCLGGLLPPVIGCPIAVGECALNFSFFGCVVGIANCVNPFKPAACVIGAVVAVAKTSNASDYEGYDVWLERLNWLITERDMLVAIFGHEQWVNEALDADYQTFLFNFETFASFESEFGEAFSDNEIQVLVGTPPEGLTTMDVETFAARWNRTIDYRAQGILNLADVPAGESTDFIAQDTVEAARTAYTASLVEAEALGFNSLGEGYVEAFEALVEDNPEESVCAKITLQINQSITLTRTGFKASLTMSNGTAEPLTDLLVDVIVTDANGVDVSHLFGISPPELTAIDNVDGTGVVAAGTDGMASWLLVPTEDAAPLVDTQYFVGGRLAYREGGNLVDIPLEPVPITVRPDAALEVDYFHQRDVYADDPFTEQEEPSIPFSLGVLVHNRGAGAARQLSIDSAQPEIIDNEKGLLIDFEMIATQIGNDSLSPSLRINFGDIAPGESVVGRWLMTSTLQGHFTDYSATFTHVNPLGMPGLSLVKRVDIHELIHLAQSSGAEDDGQPDFLVNDIPDGATMPDTIYLSEGGTAPVFPVDDAAVDTAPVPGSLAVTLNVTPNVGWNYVRMPDPGNGLYHLVRVVRSDGSELSAHNHWLTDRTFPQVQELPIYEDLLHLVDDNSTGSYTLYFQPGEDVGPKLLSITESSNQPQTDPRSQVNLLFDEAVDASSFTTDDLSLTRDGVPVSLAGVTIVQDAPGQFRITGLDAETQRGLYILTLDLSGITDLLGNAGFGSAETSWIMGGDTLTVVDIQGIAPDLRNSMPPVVQIIFSTEIDPQTLSLDDLVLTFNGQVQSTNGLELRPVDELQFQLIGLTGNDGDYRLTVHADGVEDVLGQPGVGSLQANWTLDTAGPVLQAVSGPPALTNNTVDAVILSFNEPVDMASLQASIFGLTRNNAATALPMLSVSAISPLEYRVTGFSSVTGIDGNYLLSVDASTIRDVAGNTGLGSGQALWTLDTTPPAGITGFSITPDTGADANDGITKATALTLSGVLPEANLTVSIIDTTTGANLGNAQVSGTAFSLATSGLRDGNHNLSIALTDAAGNRATTSASFFIDATPPAITDVAGLPTGEGHVTELTLTTTEAIVLPGFLRSALHLSRNGGPNLITDVVTVVRLNETQTHISGLLPLNQGSGLYTLAINTTGIADIAGNPGNGSAVYEWRVTNLAPTLNPIADQTVVPDEAFTLTVTATDGNSGDNLSYSLDIGAPDGMAITAEGVFTWTPTSEQVGEHNVTIRVSDDGNPDLSDNQTVTFLVATPIEIAQQPTDQIVCDGDEAVFSVIAVGTAPLTYQWRKDSVDLTGETGEELRITATSETAGSYDCIVTNPTGSVTADTAQLTLDTPPQITNDLESVTTCEGTAVTLEVAASGTDPITYQWRKDGADLAGETGTSLTLAGNVADSGSTYTCLISSGCGSVLTQVSTLTVYEYMTITTQPQSVVAYPGDAVVLDVVTTGSEPKHHFWYKDGVLVQKTFTSDLVIDPVTDADVGRYHCAIGNDCGSVVTNTVTVGPRETHLLPVTPLLNQDFGNHVAIDGTDALLGLPDDDTTGEGAGAVLHFRRTEAGWQQIARIEPDNATPANHFGALSLHADLLAVGAPGTGTVTVFGRDNDLWSQQDQLTAPLGSTGLGYLTATWGHRVAAAADDAIYIFSRITGAWTLEATLQPEGMTSGMTLSALGLWGDDLAVSLDGTVHLYTFDGTDWVTDGTAKVVGAAGFGQALTMDQNFLAIGASGDGTAQDTGRVLLWEKQAGIWQQTGELLPEAGRMQGAYGTSVTRYAELLVVGDPEADHGVTGTGAAYVYHWDGATWQHRYTLAVASGENGDALGEAVAVGNDLVLAGAPGDDAAGSDAGSVLAVDLRADLYAPPVLREPELTLPCGDPAVFSWTGNGAPITDWRLSLGNTPGAADLYDSGWLGTQATVSLDGLPTDGRALYVRLTWNHEGIQRHRDFPAFAQNAANCQAVYAAYAYTRIQCLDYTVINGDMGVREDSSFSTEMIIEYKTRVNGNITANAIKLEDRVEIDGAMHYNIRRNSNYGTATEYITPLDLPVPDPTPTMPVFEAGGANVTVKKSAPESLEPGSYGKVKLVSGSSDQFSILNLAAGVYYIDDLKIQGYGEIRCHGPVVLNINKKFKMMFNGYVGPADGVSLKAGDIDIFVHNVAGVSQPTVIGAENQIYAHLVNPLGEVKLGNKTQFIGSIIAEKIFLDSEVTLTYQP